MSLHLPVCLFVEFVLKFCIQFNLSRHRPVSGKPWKHEPAHLLYFLFTEEDYRNLVEKYATIREDFNKKMEESCKVSS